MLVLPEDPTLHMPEFTLYTPEEPGREQQIEPFRLSESVATLQWNVSRYTEVCKSRILGTSSNSIRDNFREALNVESLVRVIQQ